MKKSLILSFIGIILFSCNNGNPEVESLEVRILKYPKEIFTTASGTDESLMLMLKNDLHLEKFKIEKTEKEKSYSQFDGNRKVNVVLQGNGITKYFIKRQEAKPEGYYPDFTMYVISLKNEGTAKRCFDKLYAAMHSRGLGEERMKNVETITQNGNHIFFLSTRGELFRGYINVFAEKIHNY